MLTSQESKYLDHARRWFGPPCYPPHSIERVEEGWEWLLRKTKGQPLTDLMGRLESDQVRSAVEEILLARGFVKVFGERAVTPYPKIGGGEQRGEFRIEHDGTAFLIEATGLTSPEEDRLFAEAIERNDFGGFHKWVNRHEDMGRFCEKIATKVAERPVMEPLVLCLNQFVFSPEPSTGGARLRHFLLHPDAYCVPSTIPLLAVCYATLYKARGAWFSKRVCNQFGITSETTQQVAKAVQESYFAGPDGFFEWCVIE